MLFKIFALSALVVATSASNAGSWNQLAGSDFSIFHPSIDSVQSKSLEASALVAEISELLGQRKVLDSVYNSYLIAYKEEIGRSLNPEAKEIFKSNLIEIIQHNLEADQGMHSWTEGVNQFTDMSSEEFSQLLGLKMHPSKYFAKAGIPKVEFRRNGDAPDDADWKNKSSPVKNQGRCGSCYAFAAVGALECNYNIKNNEIQDLSEQQIVDCSDNSGCDGGTLEYTNDYIIEKGLTTEKQYPYKGKQGKCLETKVTVAGPTITSYTTIKSETDLVDAVAEGCVVIAVDAGGSGWQRYKTGVLTNCGKSLNHAVIAAGYGTEKGKQFWNIKNSWGTGWGDNGYIKIGKGSGTCGVGKWSTPIQTN